MGRSVTQARVDLQLAEQASTAVTAELGELRTREASVRETLREFFQGSVASHLAHRQHRPVLVVPLNPVAGSEPLPWE